MSVHRFSDNGLLSIRDFGSYLWYGFYCPGCKRVHTVQVGRDGDWTFNGDESEPTFSQSVLAKGVKNPWPPFDSTPLICHSFVRKGYIDFLHDCSHELAGKIVPMVPIPQSEYAMQQNCVEE